MEKLRIKGCDKTVALDRVIIGTNRYGAAMTQQQAFEQLDLYFDKFNGGTIDTASVYGETVPGISKSERVIGNWLKGRDRKRVKIITKGCCYKLNAPQQPRLSPQALKQDLYQSLDALGTDYIDVYLLHRDDPSVPVGEMVDALDEYVSQGLLHAVGVSNWWMHRILEANAYAKAHGRAPFAASQIQWSYVPQTIGQEILKEENNGWMTDKELSAYQASDIAVLAYFSQARGYVPQYLSGAGLIPGAQAFDNEISRARALRADELAKQTGYTPTQISLAYLLHSGVQSAVLVGADNEEQLRDSVSCVEVVLTPEQVSYLRGTEVVG